MSVKTILVAHRLAAVRDRFAAAFADARHGYVMADTAAGAVQAATRPDEAIHLVVVDLGLDEAGDGLDLARALAAGADGQARPVIVFSGSVRSADHVRQLAAANIAGYLNEHASTAQILPALAPHLFPDNFNRRSAPRLPVEVPVAVRAGETVAGAVTLNVSRGGVALRTMSPMEVATILGLSFRLPGTTTEIEATGRVAWTDRNRLVGVQFDTLSESAENAIGDLTG
jgi:CheY-like chemotaxis protein